MNTFHRVLQRFALASGLACLLAVSAPVRAQQDVKLVLDWSYQGNHAFFTLADDRGYYAADGLRVKIDRGFGSGDTIAKVAGGTYDFGFADTSLLVQFNAKNPDNKVLCVMMLFDGTLNAIVTKTSSGIRHPKDLEGRKVAAPPADNSRLLFPIFAHANGIDESKINWQSVQPNVRDTLMFKGEVDAVASVYTSTILSLESLGMKRSELTVLRYSELGADLYGSGVIVSEKFLNAHPDWVRGFLRATARGTKESIADPKAGIASVLKRDNLLTESVETSRLEMIRDLSMARPAVKANGLSYVDSARLESTIKFIAQSMGVANPPAARDVYRGEFLPPASERMIF